jgi:hypothetical protein
VNRIELRRTVKTINQYGDMITFIFLENQSKLIQRMGSSNTSWKKDILQKNIIVLYADHMCTGTLTGDDESFISVVTKIICSYKERT